MSLRNLLTRLDRLERALDPPSRAAGKPSFWDWLSGMARVEDLDEAGQEMVRTLEALPASAPDPIEEKIARLLALPRGREGTEAGTEGPATTGAYLPHSR